MHIRIRKLPLRILFATVTFALGVLVTMLGVVPRLPVKEQTVQVEIPDWPGEAVFFEQLETRTTAVNLPSLRMIVLPEDDLEVRFWYDRLEIIDGLVIRRTGSQWSASWIYQAKDHLPSSAKMVTLGPPKSGWESFLEEPGQRRNIYVTSQPATLSDRSSGWHWLYR